MLTEQTRGGSTRKFSSLFSPLLPAVRDDGSWALSPANVANLLAPHRAPFGKLAKGRIERKKGDPQNFPKLWAFSHLGDRACRLSKYRGNQATSDAPPRCIKRSL